jgi:hypothetical protein
MILENTPADNAFDVGSLPETFLLVNCRNCAVWEVDHFIIVLQSFNDDGLACHETRDFLASVLMLFLQDRRYLGAWLLAV